MNRELALAQSRQDAVADLSDLMGQTSITRASGVTRIELCGQAASRIHASLAGIEALSRLLAADQAEECFEGQRFTQGTGKLRAELLNTLSALADYCGEDISNLIEREQRRPRAA
jgi:hypothetical protein